MLRVSKKSSVKLFIGYVSGLILFIENHLVSVVLYRNWTFFHRYSFGVKFVIFIRGTLVLILILQVKMTMISHNVTVRTDYAIPFSLSFFFLFLFICPYLRLFLLCFDDDRNFYINKEVFLCSVIILPLLVNHSEDTCSSRLILLI